MTAFSGFKPAAFEFYRGLEADNSKEFWQANKATFDTEVNGQLHALTEELAEEFGEAKIFRPQRDIRFSNDKSPYKTHLGAFVGKAPSTGLYVQISQSGILVGGGFHDSTPGLLAAVRDGIQDDTAGPALEGIIQALEKQKFVLEGEQLKTAPRGIDKDHPRIDLLRRKSLTVGKEYAASKVSTKKFADVVRSEWTSIQPFVDWIATAAKDVEVPTGGWGRRG